MCPVILKQDQRLHRYWKLGGGQNGPTGAIKSYKTIKDRERERETEETMKTNEQHINM